MSLVHSPVWTKGNIAITVLQVLGLGSAAGELQGQNAGYSKFADPNAGIKVPSRVGMVFLYSPALAVSLRYLRNSPNSNGRERITALLLTIHFAKRVLESLFLHRYSGTMNGDFLLPIGTVYALTAALVAHQQRAVVAYASTRGSRIMLRLGLLLSAVGQLGNLYHHWLLATLRPAKASGVTLLETGAGKPTTGEASVSQKRYVIPYAGMFKYVTAPHYFFELVAWLGIACTTQQLNVFLSVAQMFSYLGGRSVATTKWYESKFADYPADRKHMIPFVF